jgi:hypothetical protein
MKSRFRTLENRFRTPYGTLEPNKGFAGRRILLPEALLRDFGLGDAVARQALSGSAKLVAKTAFALLLQAPRAAC